MNEKVMIDINQYRLYKGCLEFYDDLYLGKFQDKKSLNLLMKKSGALFIKQVYDFDCTAETNFWYIIQDKFIEIDKFKSKNVKKQIRKSLSTYRYELVTPKEMHNVGYKIYCEAFLRYGKDKPDMDENMFHEYLDEAISRGVEYWIGYHVEDNLPAMFEAVLVQKDCVVEEMEKLSVYYTKNNPTYGLNYELTRYYLKERGLKYIIAGSRSLTEHSNVQNFLIDKFEFRRAYCRIQLHYQMKIKIAIFLLKPLKKILKPFFPSSISSMLVLDNISNIK
ncbi:hypothetical protein [Porphyromonas pogonae]|uniref:hypothetical protein n=1 Tax=Porphyromonas pogonae TaxID=867595 RepID=UPI002E786637|nr:hypothetical protein [Porphyromonas pogonae]